MTWLLLALLHVVAHETTCSYERVVLNTVSDSCMYSGRRSLLEVGSSTSAWKDSPSLAQHTSWTIADGWLSNGSFVGTFTSQLQSFINSSYPPVSSSNYSGLTFINSSALDHLQLRGAYLCDVPLRLPSMFVLDGTAGFHLKPAANQLKRAVPTTGGHERPISVLLASSCSVG